MNLTMASGFQSDGEEAEDYGPMLNRTSWFLVLLATLLLGLRVFCKVWRRRNLWWDDWVLVASWVALVVSTSLQSASVSYGLGKHSRDIDPHNMSTIALLNYAAGFASALAAVWSKTSFALTLLRISEGWMKWVVWFIIVSVNIVMGVNGTIQWIQCWPVEKLWHPKVHGSCWPSVFVKDYNTFVSAYFAAMDVALALIPWKIVWKAMISKKEKFGALFVMSLGILAGITSLLKITTLSAIGNADIQNVVSLFIFGTAEGAITIMAASMPILRALLQSGAGPWLRPPPADDVSRPDSLELTKEMEIANFQQRRNGKYFDNPTAAQGV